MNPEVGSIMAFFHSQFPVKVYTEEVPENFEVPSMYFPTAFDFDSNDTNMTFTKTFSLPVKLFHNGQHQAKNEADKITDAIRKKKSVIPLLKADGSSTGQYIRVNRIESRVTESVAHIVVNWDSRYYYDREEWPSLENFEFENGVKT